MKRLSVFSVVTMLMISLVACNVSESGNESNNSSNNAAFESDDKGTRSNPYKIGEKIEIADISTVYDMEEYEDIEFGLSFCVDQSYSPDEGIRLKETRYDTFTAVPAAKITFKLTGNYDDELTWTNIFSVFVITDEMETHKFSSFEGIDDFSNIRTIYTGEEYTYHVLTAHDTKTNITPVSKYLVLEYRNTNKETHSLYFSLEESVNHGESAIENVEAEAAVDSDENKEYSSAIAAMEKGYYKIAENLFEKAGNYEDAESKYSEMKELLSLYDGTYYGYSTQYDNVKVYVYIKDGNVACQFEGRDISPDRYELFLYGSTQDGTDLMAFAPSRTDLFNLSNDTEYGDGFAIQSDSSGGYIIAATEGSTSYSWNGLFEKISDDVDENIFN